MARKSKNGATEFLREDLMEVLKHQSETARHQQEIRDRWFRFYLTMIGSALTLVGVVVAARIQVKEPDGTNGLVQFPGTVLLGCLCFLFLFVGAVFLGLYLLQTASYHLNYHVIERVYESLYLIHRDKIEQLKLPQPFVYSYGRHTLLSLSNSDLGASPKERWINIMKDPRLWAADFWATCLHMMLNSVCIVVLIVLRWPETSFVWVALFIALAIFVAQIVVRQMLVAYLFGLAFEKLSELWPEKKGVRTIEK